MKTMQLFSLALASLCVAVSPAVWAVNPPPDGCYPNFTTAEGCNALNLLTTGAGNTGLGWYSLSSDSTGSFNTGVGGGALALNNADSNTAVGAAALLLNTSGTLNTAIGTDALVSNDSGSNNVAVGAFALQNNDSDGNTAVGFNAGRATTTGFNDIYFGDTAGTLDLNGAAVPAGEFVTTRVGSVFTEPPALGTFQQTTFIGGIRTNFQPIGAVPPVVQVTIDLSTGALGWDLGPNNPGATPSVPPHALGQRSAPLPRSRPQPASPPNSKP